jgi:hypothetical protein
MLRPARNWQVTGTGARLPPRISAFAAPNQRLLSHRSEVVRILGDLCDSLVKKAAATRRLLVSMQLGHAGRRLGLPRSALAFVDASERRRVSASEARAGRSPSVSCARRPALASPRGSEREPLAWPTRSEPRAVATSPAGRRTRASCRCAPWTRPAAAGRGTSRPPSRGRPTTAPAWSTRRSAASVPPG